MGKNGSPVIAENRRARFDYEILDTFETGIELRGFEVKSAKAGRMNIVGSYAIIRGGELWLVNSNIPPYQQKNMPADYDASRARRLLAHKDEIKNLAGAISSKKTLLVLLRVYIKKGFIKLELGLAKPRKKSDKREILKKRTAEREMRRTSSR